MTLASTSLGLACRCLTAVATPIVQPQVKELLGIPKEIAVYDLMAVGYSASEPRPRPVRDLEDMVHYDHFDESRFITEEQLKIRLRKDKGWMQATTRRSR